MERNVEKGGLGGGKPHVKSKQNGGERGERREGRETGEVNFVRKMP